MIVPTFDNFVEHVHKSLPGQKNKICFYAPFKVVLYKTECLRYNNNLQSRRRHNIKFNIKKHYL